MLSVLKLVRLETQFAADSPTRAGHDIQRLRYEGDPADFGIATPIRCVVFKAMATGKLHRLVIRNAAQTVYSLETLLGSPGRPVTAGDMLLAMSSLESDSRLLANISAEGIRLHEIVVLVDLIDPMPSDIEFLVVMAMDR